MTNDHYIATDPKAPFYFVLAICVITLAGALYTSWRQWDAERAKTNKAISQTLAPQPTPQAITLAPAPTPGPARSRQQYVANNPPAPRATLVKLPPPRAQLVQLPPLRIGRQYLATMPYGIDGVCLARMT